MIRIVGVQRSEAPEREFILLQNQGSMRVSLRGHCVVSESAVGSGDLGIGAHVFADEEMIPAGQYVLLVSGCGMPRWAKSKDGSLIYHAYVGSSRPVWSRCDLPLHVLAPHHTYAERGEALLMR